MALVALGTSPIMQAEDPPKPAGFMPSKPGAIQIVKGLSLARPGVPVVTNPEPDLYNCGGAPVSGATVVAYEPPKPTDPIARRQLETHAKLSLPSQVPFTAIAAPAGEFPLPKGPATAEALRHEVMATSLGSSRHFDLVQPSLLAPTARE